MNNRQCPKCGEEYSDTYRTCPFCEEEAAIKKGKPLRRRSGKRVEKRQRDSSGGAGGIMLLLTGVIILGVVGYVFFGEQVADAMGIRSDPVQADEDPAADPPPAGPGEDEPAQPDPPLVFADNGVEARTLVPSSPEGYIVSGGVYINNRTEYPLDASLLDGTFAAALPEEEGPQILIVHTHGSEAYTMPPGQEYEPSGESRTTDTSLNVVRVGDELAKTLEEAGLTVLHDPTLHDYPEYSGAYGRSLDAVNAYLAEYPTISFVLDVHRDAISDGDGTPYKVVSGVAGLNAAQMSFVIGTDGGGLEHPDNLKLAAAIQQRLTADYPTLMRPITVRNSRYNQHTTPGSLLVEMGAAGNSLDEALLSARLLGKALAETILEKGA